jgi:DNA-binding CsgD family transcriptional regulator
MLSFYVSSLFRCCIFQKSVILAFERIAKAMYDTRSGKCVNSTWKRRAMSLSAIVEERVFSEISRLCHSDLDEVTLLREVIARLRQAIPIDIYWAQRIDPLSGLPTGMVSEATDQLARARFFLEHIYFEDDVLEFNWMARNRHTVALLSEGTRGNLERSLHWRELLGPEGFGHEARGVFTVGEELWGALCAVRERGRPDFSAREVALMRRIAPHLGAGLKAAVLRSQASPEDNGDVASGGVPGVLVLDQRGWVLHYTAAAERWLRDLGDLGPGWREGEGLPVAIWSAVGALRRALKPPSERARDSVPQVCVKARSGQWLILHTSMSESQDLSSPGEIVIVIEPAGFKEMAWLHTATYGLSPREEEVVEFVVHGASTRQISQALYVTEDTVQKHLQNVFEKVGVRSRQALVKRLYLNTIFP